MEWPEGERGAQAGNAIWMAETRANAQRAFALFLETYRVSARNRNSRFEVIPVS